MNMNFTIRDADLGDAEGIRALNVQLGYDYPAEKTERHLDKALSLPYVKICVAEADGKIVGYIHAADYECTYADTMKDILALVVDESCRGAGVGRALLAAAEAWARDTGAAGIHLVSGWNRTGAHRFYEKCGYVNRKDQKNFMKWF